MTDCIAGDSVGASFLWQRAHHALPDYDRRPVAGCNPENQRRRVWIHSIVVMFWLASKNTHAYGYTRNSSMFYLLNNHSRTVNWAATSFWTFYVIIIVWVHALPLSLSPSLCSKPPSYIQLNFQKSGENNHFAFLQISVFPIALKMRDLIAMLQRVGCVILQS